MGEKHIFLIDTGVERLHLRVIDAAGRVIRESVRAHRGKLKGLLAEEMALAAGCDPCGGAERQLWLTGKLSREAAAALGGGTRLLTEAVLLKAGRRLQEARTAAGEGAEREAIIDFSASGYCIVAVGSNDDRAADRVVKNPACGAGSGVNLRRVLEKLAIAPAAVDDLLAPYLGDDGAALRRALPVRKIGRAHV